MSNEKIVTPWLSMWPVFVGLATSTVVLYCIISWFLWKIRYNVLLFKPFACSLVGYDCAQKKRPCWVNAFASVATGIALVSFTMFLCLATCLLYVAILLSPGPFFFRRIPLGCVVFGFYAMAILSLAMFWYQNQWKLANVTKLACTESFASVFMRKCGYGWMKDTPRENNLRFGALGFIFLILLFLVFFSASLAPFGRLVDTFSLLPLRCSNCDEAYEKIVPHSVEEDFLWAVSLKWAILSVNSIFVFATAYCIFVYRHAYADFYIDFQEQVAVNLIVFEMDQRYKDTPLQHLSLESGASPEKSILKTKSFKKTIDQEVAFSAEVESVSLFLSELHEIMWTKSSSSRCFADIREKNSQGFFHDSKSMLPHDDSWIFSLSKRVKPLDGEAFLKKMEAHGFHVLYLGLLCYFLSLVVLIGLILIVPYATSFRPVYYLHFVTFAIADSTLLIDFGRVTSRRLENAKYVHPTVRLSNYTVLKSSFLILIFRIVIISVPFSLWFPSQAIVFLVVQSLFGLRFVRNYFETDRGMFYSNSGTSGNAHKSRSLLHRIIFGFHQEIVSLLTYVYFCSITLYWYVSDRILHFYGFSIREWKIGCTGLLALGCVLLASCLKHLYVRAERTKVFTRLIADNEIESEMLGFPGAADTKSHSGAVFCKTKKPWLDLFWILLFFILTLGLFYFTSYFIASEVLDTMEVGVILGTVATQYPALLVGLSLRHVWATSDFLFWLPSPKKPATGMRVDTPSRVISQNLDQQLQRLRNRRKKIRGRNCLLLVGTFFVIACLFGWIAVIKLGVSDEASFYAVSVPASVYSLFLGALVAELWFNTLQISPQLVVLYFSHSFLVFVTFSIGFIDYFLGGNNLQETTYNVIVLVSLFSSAQLLACVSLRTFRDDNFRLSGIIGFSFVYSYIVMCGCTVWIAHNFGITAMLSYLFCVLFVFNISMVWLWWNAQLVGAKLLSMRLKVFCITTVTLKFFCCVAYIGYAFVSPSVDINGFRGVVSVLCLYLLCILIGVFMFLLWNRRLKDSGTRISWYPSPFGIPVFAYRLDRCGGSLRLLNWYSFAVVFALLFAQLGAVVLSILLEPNTGIMFSGLSVCGAMIFYFHRCASARLVHYANVYMIGPNDGLKSVLDQAICELLAHSNSACQQSAIEKALHGKYWHDQDFVYGEYFECQEGEKCCEHKRRSIERFSAARNLHIRAIFDILFWIYAKNFVLSRLPSELARARSTENVFFGSHSKREKSEANLSSTSRPSPASRLVFSSAKSSISEPQLDSVCRGISNRNFMKSFYGLGNRCPTLYFDGSVSEHTSTGPLVPSHKLPENISVFLSDEEAARTLSNILETPKGELVKPWVDVSFPASNESLFLNREDECDSTGLDECSDDESAVIWCRTAELYPPQMESVIGRRIDVSTASNPATGHACYDPSDMAQGELADCWLVSALGVIALYPRLLDRVLVTKERNEQGVYCVRLLVDENWVNVLIDDLFPCSLEQSLVFDPANHAAPLQVSYEEPDICNSNFSADKFYVWGRKWRLPLPLYCHTRNYGGIWPMIIEKAYAKRYGSYAALDRGQVLPALVDLTGGFCELLSLHDDVELLMSGDLWKKLYHLREEGALLVAGSPSVDSGAQAPFNGSSMEGFSPQGILYGHAFSITAVERQSDYHGTHFLLQICDPSGRSYWCGRWGKSDERSWTRRMQKRLRYTVDDGSSSISGWRELKHAMQYSTTDTNTETFISSERELTSIATGDYLENNNASIFWMSLEDFVKQFEWLYVCRFFDNTQWIHASVDGVWRGQSAGGPPNQPEAKKNPQFFVTLIKNERNSNFSDARQRLGCCLGCSARKRTVKMFVSLSNTTIASSFDNTNAPDVSIDRLDSGRLTDARTYADRQFPFMSIILLDIDGKRLENNLLTKQIVASSGKYRDMREVSFETTLNFDEQKVYTLFPSLYPAGVEGSFRISVYCTEDFRLSPAL